MTKENNDNTSSPAKLAKVSFVLFLTGIGVVILAYVAVIIERVYGAKNVVSTNIKPFIELAGCFLPVIIVAFSICGLFSFMDLLRDNEKTVKPYVYALISFITGLIIIWTVAIASIIGVIKCVSNS